MPATDAQTSVSHVRISNSSKSSVRMLALAKELPFSTTINWDLSDGSAGGTSATGEGTVYVQWRDRAGNWSQIQSDTIVYNTGSAVARAFRRLTVLPSVR